MPRSGPEGTPSRHTLSTKWRHLGTLTSWWRIPSQRVKFIFTEAGKAAQQASAQGICLSSTACFSTGLVFMFHFTVKSHQIENTAQRHGACPWPCVCQAAGGCLSDVLFPYAIPISCQTGYLSAAALCFACLKSACSFILTSSGALLLSLAFLGHQVAGLIFWHKAA